MAKEINEREVSRRAFFKVSDPMTAGELSLSTGFLRDVVAE